MKEILEPKGAEWLETEIFLRVLAPDLLERCQKEMETDTDGLSVYEEILGLRTFAMNMVRFAKSPKHRDYEARDGNKK